jgi:hypothetical protein
VAFVFSRGDRTALSINFVSVCNFRMIYFATLSAHRYILLAILFVCHRRRYSIYVFNCIADLRRLAVCACDLRAVAGYLP